MSGDDERNQPLQHTLALGSRHEPVAVAEGTATSDHRGPAHRIAAAIRAVPWAVAAARPLVRAVRRSRDRLLGRRSGEAGDVAAPPDPARSPAGAPERAPTAPLACSGPSAAERCDAHLRAMRYEVALRPGWRGRGDNVVMVIGTLGPGGAERQLVNVAGELLRLGRGACHTVLLRDTDGTAGHYQASLAERSTLHRSHALQPGPAIEAMRAGGLGFLVDVLPPQMYWDVPPLLELFRTLQPSVVHAWLDWNNVVAGLAAALLPVKRIVLSTRNVGPQNFASLDQPWFRGMYRMLLADPRVTILNNSEAGAEDYAQWLGIARDRIRVVRNGLDCVAMRSPGPAAIDDLRRSIGAEPGHRIVAGVFRLAEEKQPHQFVAVAERVLAADPSALVVHAGIGTLTEQFQALVERSPHRDRYRVLGRRDDVQRLLAAAEVCLLTSSHEGTPNVLIEAQHVGCPVVSTRAGGAPETFSPGRTGLLCEIGDVDALAAATLRLLREPQLRGAMSAAGPPFVRERFGLERMARETIALYG